MSADRKVTRAEYKVAIADPNEPVVDVALRLDGIPEDLPWIELQMPERYAFQSFAEPFISEIAGDAALERESPHVWRVRPRSPSTVALRWRVPLVHRQRVAPSPPDSYEHPYLAADHGLLVAGTMFLVPVNVAVEDIRVRFDLPEGWALLSPWPASSPGTFAPGAAALADDVIAVGRWSVSSVQVGGFVGVIAYAPGQEALEELATPVISRIIEAELALFGVSPGETYLFVFGRPDMEGFAGSPKHGSMALSVSPALATAELVGGLAHLVAHEFHHIWSRSRYSPPDTLRFFDEGFTDYYAYRISAELGLVTADQLAGAVVSAVETYRERSARSLLTPIAAGGPVFVRSEDASAIVYAGGLALAALLDVELRQAGRADGLDELMRSFNNDDRWKRGAVPTVADFLEVVERFTDATTRGEVAGWLDGSSPAAVEAGLEALCSRVRGGV